MFSPNSPVVSTKQMEEDPISLLGVMCWNAQVELGVLEIIQHRIVSIFGSRLGRNAKFFHKR